MVGAPTSLPRDGAQPGGTGDMSSQRAQVGPVASDPAQGPVAVRFGGDPEWVAGLSATGGARAASIEELRTLLVRAARFRVSGMSEANNLGAVHREEIVQSAANEATMSVLARLHTFEGRSRFTTWAYKFGILHAGVEVRRSIWNDNDISLDDLAEPTQSESQSPEMHAEGRSLAEAVGIALNEALTPHQRRIAVALLVDEVPIDVLADRLGTTRGALYKTVHDARNRLRAHLKVEGYILSETKQVTT